MPHNGLGDSPGSDESCRFLFKALAAKASGRNGRHHQVSRPAAVAHALE